MNRKIDGAKIHKISPQELRMIQENQGTGS